MKIHRNKKGFTLIELIVVIAILAILAAILVPTISGFIGKANQATDVANAKMLYNAGMMVLSQGGAAADFTSSTGDIAAYVSAWPVPKSYATGNTFKVSVTATTVTVSINNGNALTATFNQGTGKLS